MAASPDIINGVLGQYYQLRQNEEIIFNYQPEANGFRHAYLLTYVRKGHEHCGCMRGRRLEYFMLHNPQTGTWPNNFRVTEMCAGELQDYLGDDYRLWLRSYVLIRPSFGRVVRVGALPDWQREQAHMETESESE